MPALTEPDDWAMPDYDAGNTRSPPGYAAPDDLDTAADWTVEFTEIEPDDVAGPVVADGVAYVALAGRRRGREAERLVALDARTGDERWRVSGPGGRDASPPVVSGETVFWLTSAGELRALHPTDGSTRWTRDVRNHSRQVPAHGLVLTVRGSHSNPRLAAIDPRSGTPYWTRSEGERGWDVLAADDDAFYVRLGAATDDQPVEFHALDPLTGESRWSTSRVESRGATVHAGTVYCSSGRPDARELLAFDTGRRDAEWSEIHDLQRTDDGVTTNGAQNVAAVTDDLLLLHYDFHGATHDRIEARDPDTGDALWTVAGTGDDPVLYAPPVVAGNRVYLVQWRYDDAGDTDSTLRVLDRDGGDELTRLDLPEPTVTAPVVADGRLFLRTEPTARSAGISVL